MQRTGDLVVEL